MIAMDLAGIVEGLGHRVTAVARTHREAVKATTKQTPGLVLADIQLADGSSGLDAVNEMLGSFEVPVIFMSQALFFERRAHLRDRPSVRA